MIKKNKISLLIICVLAFAVAAYYFFYSNRGNNPQSEGLSHLKVETFKKETGWAYRIYQDTTVRIEQIYIPGVPGTSGFQSEEQALKTGKLVKKKLEMGIFPPTINSNELDSMGVQY